MAFTIGSGTFTNGSATVTGVTLTSGTLAYFASGTRMVVGVNPVIQEVEAIAAPTVSTITLRSAWTGTGGTYSFLANQTSEGLRDAVQAIRTNNASLQSFIDSIDTAATADSVAQRTSDGSLNAVNVYASGNLGVGTASPSVKLHAVNDGAGEADVARFSRTNSGDLGFLDIGINPDTNEVIYDGSGSAAMSHVFRTGGADRLRIDSSGNVGIGTSSPIAKLDIDGGANIRGDNNLEFDVSTAGNSKVGRTDRAFLQINRDNFNGFLTFTTTSNGTNGLAERMRIDSSGNVLVGTTSTDFNSFAGFRVSPLGNIYATTINDAPALFNRRSSDGAIVNFRKDGTTVGSIGTVGGSAYIAGVTGSCGIGFSSSGGQPFLSPTSPTGAGTDNVVNLGGASSRFEVLYAGTGSINTSDAREKTAVEEFTADELNAAKQLSKEIGAYKFLSAVAKKGDDARKHVGMTVQRAIEIMEANNLDPFAYGFICYDAWEEKTVDHPAVEAVEGKEAWTEIVEHEAEYDEDGEVIKEAWAEIIEHEAVEAVEAKDAYTEVVQEAGDRYSFRPDEMLFFIARGLEARIEALEG